MKIKTEQHSGTRVRNVYQCKEIVDRESSIRWIISASEKLPFDKKTIRVDDGDTFHDGTLSKVFNEIPNANSFVNEYLNTPIYSIAVYGYYKNAYLSVQIHLDLRKIFIGCEENELDFIVDIEKILDLDDKKEMSNDNPIKNKKEIETVMEETKQVEVENEGGEQVIPTPSDDNVVLEKLEALQQAMQGLQECFDSKIATDAHKNGLFDNMHKELTRYQNGAMDKIVDTIALDIIQLVDTTKGHLRVYEKKEPNEENYKRLLRIVKGVTEDLQDILYRQSIEAYRVEGHEVDVRRQKIIQTIPTDDQSKDNLVAVRAADGYEKDGKVLRPERIKIFKYSTEATNNSDEN